MTEANVCSKCQSDKVIPQICIMDRGHYSTDAGDLTLVLYEDPEAMFFKGKHDGLMYARACGNCGYVELFLKNPQELYRIYQDIKNKQP